MYKVVKEMGKTENVCLQNTDTMAEINLGRITAGIVNALRKDGYKFETVDEKEDRLTLKEKWNLKVSNEVKDELRKLAIPMKKPIRNQRKVKEEKTEIVNALDLIFNFKD